MCAIWLLISIGYLYLSAMWFQEWLSKDMCLEEIGLHAQNMITILGSIVNRIGGTYMTI
jgi:hypothetical protein